MIQLKTLGPGQTLAKRTAQSLSRLVCLSVASAAVLISPLPAHAIDACQVLMCMASSNWRKIPQCVPPVQQVLRDMSRGKPFPTCSFSGGGNAASQTWASAPGYCPPQYTRVFEGESGPVYTCDYAGAVMVNINGAAFTRTWWNAGGDTVTEFTPVAKAQLGTWDTKFDDDYAAWFAALPPPAPVAESGY